MDRNSGTKTPGERPSMSAPAPSTGSTTTPAARGTTVGSMGYTAIEDTRKGAIYNNLVLSDLKGMNIENAADNKKVGDISVVLAGADGKAKAVVADVGGFLGIGSDKVIVPLDRLNYDPQKKRFTTSMTADQLKTLPKWNS